MLELSTPVKFVKRVGERVAEELGRRGVETVEDLLYHLPCPMRIKSTPISYRAAKAWCGWWGVWRMATGSFLRAAMHG